MSAAEQARLLEQARGIAAGLEAQLAAVMALHQRVWRPRLAFTACTECDMTWPCPTHVAACSLCAAGEPCAAAETAEPTP